MSFPIEDMDPKFNRSVLAYHRTANGMVRTQLLRQVYQGEKECIEITLEDGRTLACTPDHEIMNGNGEYVEAGQFKANQSFIRCSLQQPITHLPPASSSSTSDSTPSWQFKLNETFQFNNGDAASMIKALIFARILGFIATDGTISLATSSSSSSSSSSLPSSSTSLPTARLFFRHSYDVTSFLDEFKSAFDMDATAEVDMTTGIYLVTLPPSFTQSLINLGVTGSSRVTGLQIPSFQPISHSSLVMGT